MAQPILNLSKPSPAEPSPTASKQSSSFPVAHHIKGIRPALELMLSLGINASQCLDDTGIELQHLDQANASLELEQEYRFYRNIIAACPDPMLGVKLGAAYIPESYGLLGYAMLSADTIGAALSIAVDFGLLTFSHFALSQFEQGSLAGFAFSPQYDLPEDLLAIYSDRDIQASVTAMQASSHQQQRPTLIRLMHKQLQWQSDYEQRFGCPVEFGHHRNEIFFDKQLLATPLPQRDSQTSQYCQLQCQSLLQSLSKQGGFIDRVRAIIIAQPGHFPNIEQVASQLNTSVRSLRRRLKEERSGYQQLLNEIRHQLAQDYLNTQMPIEQIAELLGYSEAANFSHAFKRWQGLSPLRYRQKNN